MEKQILRHAKTRGGKYEMKLVSEPDGTFTIVSLTNGSQTGGKVGIPEQDIAYQLFNLDCAMARDIDRINYEEVLSC